MMTINQEVERKTDIGYPELTIDYLVFFLKLFSQIPKSICLNIGF